MFVDVDAVFLHALLSSVANAEKDGTRERRETTPVKAVSRLERKAGEHGLGTSLDNAAHVSRGPLPRPSCSL
jgi:hypothetical protein